MMSRLNISLYKPVYRPALHERLLDVMNSLQVGDYYVASTATRSRYRD